MISRAKVDGKTYIAYVHEHRLEAQVDGKPVWSFLAGGRISQTPVVRGDRLWIGAHDGWVYCLRTSDGKLLWRFMAAPYEKKTVAYSQLESAWPVYGVTLYDDRLAFSAGRHSETDRGIWVYSVEPQTGKLDWKVRIQINRRENLSGLEIDPHNPHDEVVGTPTFF